MTAGDLPDIFLVQDLSTLSQLADAGVIADLTTVYQENVNPTLAGIIEGEGTDIYNPMIYDGKLVGIPVKMPSTNGYNHCWVRQDWLDELGLERPETMDDVYEITKAFKEHYPDNIGMMLNQDYIAEMKGIFWAYGGTTAVRKYWKVLDDGTLGFSEVQPEMKGGLEFLQKMYNEGLVNKEFATEDIATAFEYVANNQCGIFYGPHWYGFSMENAEASLDDSANWVACGLLPLFHLLDHLERRAGGHSLPHRRPGQRFGEGLWRRTHLLPGRQQVLPGDAGSLGCVAELWIQQCGVSGGYHRHRHDPVCSANCG